MKQVAKERQHGLSLIGFVFVIAMVALVAVLGMKVVPTVVEFAAVKSAIRKARDGATSVAEVRNSFDRQSTAQYIESVTGKDLDIVKTADGFDVSVAYEKKIPLVGPASLVLDYAATTATTMRQASAKEQ